jgi:DNA invertase Pin-like site-specific DNA recombinase
MICGYARVSTDGQEVAAQVAVLKAAGAGKVFREVASGAKTDRAQPPEQRAHDLAKAKE